MEQEIQIIKTFGCVRWVYNHCLDKRKSYYEETGKTFGLSQYKKLITQLRNEPEYYWLKEADSTALHRAAEHLDNAYQRFFDKISGYPKFKKKSNEQSYTAVCSHNSIRLDGDYIQLPKLGRVKCKVNRKVAGRILNATISRSPSGKYFVSVNCTDVDIEPLAKTKQFIGIDVGQDTYCTFSDGNKIDNPKFLKQAKVASQRRDFQHKQTKKIVTNYDIVCVETLNSNEMTDRTSTKKISKANNRSKADRAYGEFFRMLDYKCKLYGKTLIKVDKYFPSSQLCLYCGFKNEAVKNLSVRKWKCPECGQVHDRDVNAAINILNEGLRLCVE